MKHFTKLFGVGCVALLAMLFAASGAFAQTTRYVDVNNGSGADCTLTAPCLLDNAIGSEGTVLIRVRRAGSTVTLAPPASSLTANITFGAYVRGSGSAVKGTLEFEDEFTIGAGTFTIHKDATVQFEDVKLSDDATRTSGAIAFADSPADDKNHPASRLSITGTLTVVGSSNYLDALEVANDLTIEGESTSPRLRVNQLTVKRGATLTVGGSTAAAEIDLHVALKKSAKDSKNGILTVDGTIDGPGTVWFTPEARTSSFFHLSSDYQPDARNVIDHDDCVLVTGGGEIENEIRAIAAGNICINLTKIGDLTVAGSIAADATDNPDVTTDVIFRNEVEIDGDVVQWNDARVVFEKDATVTGDVILADGVLPTGVFPSSFPVDQSTARVDDGGVATSIRRGVKLASAAENDPFTCEYLNDMAAVRIVDTPVVSLSATPTSQVVGGTVTVTATLNKAHPDGTDVTVPLVVNPANAVTPANPSITIAGVATTGSVPLTVSNTPGTFTVALGEVMNARPGTTATSVSITVTPTGKNLLVDDPSDARFFKNQDTATAGPGFYIPGVLFQGEVTIEGDLDIRSDDIAGIDSAPNRKDTSCAPRVIFAAEKVGKANSAIMSRIEGDLNIEATHNDRILLDAHMDGAIISAHNLALDGEIFAEEGAPIEMENPAETLDEGECKNTLALNGGTRLILTEEGNGREISGDLMIHALVTLEDLEITGDVTVTTLHVGSGSDLEVDETLTVKDALILEGELDGALHSNSELKHLVYASRNTDIVTGLTEKGALESLSIYLDGGELRLDEVTETKNLGLCKGPLVLFAAGTDTQNTLMVTEQITVKEGTLSLDTNDPGSIGTDVPDKEADRTGNHGYILKYVVEKEHTIDSEWFTGVRKVAIDHKDAVVIVDEKQSLIEGVHIFNGHLHLKGEGSHLTIGPSSKHAPFLMIDNGELHANGNNVVVHGKVDVGKADKQTGKIMTGGGELHVLGQLNSSKGLDNATAVVTLGNGKSGATAGVGTIDVGEGALQLGPETTNPLDELGNDWQYPIPNANARRPHVKLDVKQGSAVNGLIRVPKGSKQTEIIGAKFDTIVFDGMKTPNKPGTVDPSKLNWDGTLYVMGIGAAGKEAITVDSLNASNGAVEFWGSKATITKNVDVTSANLFQQLNTLEFKKDLTISGTAGFSSREGDADAKKSLTIEGNFSKVITSATGAANEDQERGISNTPTDAIYLSEYTNLTAKKDFKVSGPGAATRFLTQNGTQLKLEGDFDFGPTAEGYAIEADVEFSGKEAQKVRSLADFGGKVEINNANGIMLESNVAQGETSTLTLTRGIIHSDQYTWTLKNPNIEEDLRGRNNAVTNCDTDENCDKVITGGTRRTHASAGVSRHVKDGISGGTAELSGGYLFPVGGTSGEEAHYRPLILQLEDDLSEAMPATVTPITVPDGATPSWPADNIVTSGGALTLDVYADIFWKVEFKDELDVHPRVRIGAGGLVNVFDQAGIRMVQWDCEWDNPKLAGTSVTGNGDESFAENGYVNGVLNLTQETVEIGTCAILGVAANGIENPIHRAEITGGLAEVQIIHNANLPAPVNVSLDGAPLLSGVRFQTATGYTKLSAGSHEVQLQLVGAPAEQTTDVTLPSLGANKSYAVIAHGMLGNLAVNTIETRLKSSTSTMVEAILVHGSGDAPAVNVNVLDPSNSNQLDRVLTRQLAFNNTTRYLQLEPDFVNLQVTTADNTEVAVFQLDLAGRQGEALILNLSNQAASLEVYGVDVNGERVAHFNVTSVAEAEELPTEFTLHGNYPNPFNPSTRIQFDLPESARVSLQIVDMLGREVMTLPAQEFEAGANRSMELNAVSLASGTYLYRMIATGAESRFVKSGRMTLVK